MKIHQSKLPFQIRRIALEHLESIRETKMGENTVDLYLSEDVVPIYRADIKTPAYYEFEICKATREKPDDRSDLLDKVKKINIHIDGSLKEVFKTPEFSYKNDNILEENVQGFMIVSADRHDFPISHWSLESYPPSRYLVDQAKSKKTKISKIFRVDTLTYLGEDENGEGIVIIGDMPKVIANYPENYNKYRGTISSSETIQTSKGPLRQEDSIKVPSGRTLKKGPKPLNYKFESSLWPAWKKFFTSGLKPMLDQLQIQASESWHILDLIEKMGEGIIAGQRFNLVPLEKEFAVEFSGDASKYLKYRIVKRPNGNSVVEIQTALLPSKGELGFSAVFNYKNKLTETINFFVVNRDTPSESISNTKNE